MIYRDEEGERWLRCDCCAGEEPREFYGIGLRTARLVRQVARDLEGWLHRQIIIRFGDPLVTRWVDLCPGCKQPEVQLMRLIGCAEQTRREAEE